MVFQIRTNDVIDMLVGAHIAQRSELYALATDTNTASMRRVCVIRGAK